MFTRINLFVGPRHHRPHFGMGGWFAPMMNPFDRMMFKMAMPLMIGNMISNLGTSIAGIISGKGTNTGGSCNCGNNYNPYNMLYGNNYNTANTLMYPYVDLNNTRQSKETEGKGGSNKYNEDATIAKMEKAYKKYGVTAIYQLDDGRYCAVTDNGNITGLTLSDLADEISDYYGKPVKDVEAAEEVVGEDGVEPPKVAADNAGQGNVENPSKFSKQFVKSEWHRYINDKNARADEYKNVALELGKTSKEAHRNNPAEYALNSLIAQLGLAGTNYDSDSYKNLLSDFKRMNPSVFNEDGTMKSGDNANKLDLPSKATLKAQYHLRDRNAGDDKADAINKEKANAANKQKYDAAQETAISKAKKRQELIDNAVSKLRYGIEPRLGYTTVKPEDITDVLFDSKIFNKDSCMDILDEYKKDYKKELFEDIDSEHWYYSDSKIQNYERILNVLIQRAKVTVKDKSKVKEITDFRDKLLGDSYKKFRQNQHVVTIPLKDQNDIETFKHIMQIMRDAG